MLDTIKNINSQPTNYYEPFVGGASVAVSMAKLNPSLNMHLSDIEPNLIILWKALQQGWQPPNTLSEEEYQKIRRRPLTSLHAFAGYGCSYGGKLWGGYARAVATDRNYASEAARLLLTKIKRLPVSKVTFDTKSYHKIEPLPNSIIYCDPPYNNYTPYDQTPWFNHRIFWKWARNKAREGHLVFVSEYGAPLDFTVVWEREHTTSLKGSMGKGKVYQRFERLFVYRK